MATTMTVTTRFAPSPSGLLHVGNVRTALHNWMLAKKHGGRFLLRIDDTDKERSREEYVDAIRADLAWLGLHPDAEERQSARFGIYEAEFAKLAAEGRVYRCYESAQELDLRRKVLLGRGLPPIYDRGALSLTEADHAAREAAGERPHWRFQLDHDSPIAWQDGIRGPQHFDPKTMSDPVIRRADGSWLYMLPSVIDDIAMGVTDVLRGEDHVSNTATQVQMFTALGAQPPRFAHEALLGRPQVDLADAQVQHGQEHGSRLLLKPANRIVQRQVVDPAVQRPGNRRRDLDSAVGIVALANIEHSRDTVDVAHVFAVEAELAAAKGQHKAVLRRGERQIVEIVAARTCPVTAADQEQVLDLSLADHGQQRIGHAHHRVPAKACRNGYFRRIRRKAGLRQRTGNGRGEIVIANVGNAFPAYRPGREQPIPHGSPIDAKPCSIQRYSNARIVIDEAARTHPIKQSLPLLTQRRFGRQPRWHADKLVKTGTKSLQGLAIGKEEQRIALSPMRNNRLRCQPQRRDGIGRGIHQIAAQQPCEAVRDQSDPCGRIGMAIE
ncbi:hypothetical protein B566_EDAN019538 [Ephemera danica]|nr:hypothetical protein B566_EDAN019538 [Ephemera danica]